LKEATERGYFQPIKLIPEFTGDLKSLIIENLIISLKKSTDKT